MTDSAEILLETLVHLYKESGTEVFTTKHFGHIPRYEHAIKELIDSGILQKYISGNVAFTQYYMKEYL